MVETDVKRPGRNEPCHCGSGKKYKVCCLVKDEEADRALREQEASAAEPAAHAAAAAAPGAAVEAGRPDRSRPPADHHATQGGLSQQVPRPRALAIFRVRRPAQTPPLRPDPRDRSFLHLRARPDIKYVSESIQGLG